MFGRLTLTSASVEQITGRGFFPPLSDGAACLRHSRVGEEVRGEEEEKKSCGGGGEKRGDGQETVDAWTWTSQRVIKAKMY